MPACVNTLEQLTTVPMEQHLNGIAFLDAIESATSPGLSTVILAFETRDRSARRVERWWCNRGCVPDSTGWLTSPESAGDLQRSSIVSRQMSRSPRASHSWWPAMRRARNSDSGSPSSGGRALSRWSVWKAPGRREWLWPGFWLGCGGKMDVDRPNRQAHRTEG